ncbi:hypothetical protein [Paraburkholderia bannensis]|uniref:hypothetical protein n=1 Tax=Paraburkholderia bannensis TaxID=765414 RepID=UPI002AB7674A|nr:hypothetical protein [Paraburkholderia bannensis]
MNSVGYPQASRLSKRLQASRKVSPSQVSTAMRSIQDHPKTIPKILTFTGRNGYRQNSSTVIFQAFGVSEYQLAPEKPHLGVQNDKIRLPNNLT